MLEISVKEGSSRRDYHEGNDTIDNSQWWCGCSRSGLHSRDKGVMAENGNPANCEWRHKGKFTVHHLTLKVGAMKMQPLITMADDLICYYIEKGKIDVKQR